MRMVRGVRRIPTGRSGSSCRFRPAATSIRLRACWRGRSRRSSRSPIVIDNRGGANGIVGADLVAKAAAQRLHAARYVVSRSSSTPACTGSCRTTAKKIFCRSPTSRWGLGYLLTVNPAVPAQSVKELIALARSSTEGLRYSTPGIGNGQHLAGELLCHQSRHPAAARAVQRRRAGAQCGAGRRSAALVSGGRGRRPARESGQVARARLHGRNAGRVISGRAHRSPRPACRVTASIPAGTAWFAPAKTPARDSE